VKSLVASLSDCFEQDTVVCLHLPNDILYPVLVLAILASGAQWTGTNPAYSAVELEHHFRLSNARYVITTAPYLDKVQLAVTESGCETEFILFTDLLDMNMPLDKNPDIQTAAGQAQASVPRLRNLRDLQSQTTRLAGLYKARLSRPDKVAALMQTSGTTGLPKLAVRTHAAMIHELIAIADDDTCKPYEVRRLFCTPVFHGFAAPEMIFNALRLGRKTFYMRRFDNTFHQKVYDFDITETFGAPTMLLRLVNKPEDYHKLQSLKYVAYGGASLGNELRRKFLDIFEHNPRLVPVYGMTEGGWFTTFKHPEDDNTGSVGRLIPGNDVKILPDPANRGTQDVGEILVRGPQLMQGYLANEQATNDAFQEGWLKTGDIGYISDGKVYLVDRAKEMIKVNGWQVSPAELQDALLECQGVLEAAVFGIGEGTDEHPVACVVSSTESAPSEMIMTHLSSRLASYKVSKLILHFVEGIPRSSTGKMQKQILKAEYLRGLEHITVQS
jgi:acyl-CoA synthetase (AMP-forming)/AMP-acid ligase II